MTIPNLLSIFRLVLAPVFAAVFFQPIATARYWAAGVYVAAFITDLVDGYIARRFDQVSRLGRLLDPLADKLMTLVVILCITAANVIPAWAVVLFFTKEALMGVGALILYRKIRDIPSSNVLGKASTGVFFVVCALLVLFPTIPQPWPAVMMSFALTLSFAALILYLIRGISLLKSQKNAEEEGDS